MSDTNDDLSTSNRLGEEGYADHGEGAPAGHCHHDIHGKVADHLPGHGSSHVMPETIGAVAVKIGVNIVIAIVIAINILDADVVEIA